MKEINASEEVWYTRNVLKYHKYANYDNLGE